MEKLIVTGSYWLGLLTSLSAVVLRFLAFFGLVPMTIVPAGHTLWYMTFFHGAVLFFLVAIATASYASVRGEKS
jgi:hypothetical protein